MSGRQARPDALLQATEVSLSEFRQQALAELERMAADLEALRVEVGRLADQLLGARAKLAQYESPSYYLRGTDISLVEIFLTLSSFWAAWVLYLPPNNFVAYPTSFSVVTMVEPDERVWALFAFLAAVLKSAGMLISLARPRTLLPWLPRYTGLGMSAFFWTVMGLSTIVGNPDTLFGFAGLLMGIFSLWALMRLLR